MSRLQTLRAGAAAAASWLRANPADVLAAAGVTALVVGAALIYGPAGWITAGLLLLAAAVVLARTEAREKGRRA